MLCLLQVVRTLLCCLLLVSAIPVTALSEEQPQLYSIGVGFEFSSGSYGSQVTTDTIYIPFSVYITPTPRTAVSLEIPFIYQSNSNVTTSVAQGARVPRTTQKTTDAIAIGGYGRGMSSTGAANMANNTSDGSGDQAKSGIGDIVLKAGYMLIAESEVMPGIKPTFFVKVPTADENEGLGTGKFDEGIAVEISKWRGDAHLFGEAGYVFQGKADGYYLRNYITWNAGAGYQLTEKLMPLLYLKGTSPPADGVDSLHEVRLKLKYRATNRTGMEGYLAKGITSGSLDYGGGAAVYYDF